MAFYGITMTDHRVLDSPRTVIGWDDWRDRSMALVGVIALLGFWQVAVVTNDISPLILPTPIEVGQQLVRLFGESGFWYDAGISVFEFAVGFIVGSIFGVLIGVLTSESRQVGLLLNPLIHGLRFIVPFAWISLTILWFGTSLIGKLFLVTYAVFFVMVVSTQQALKNMDPTLTQVATMLGMSRWERVLRVHLRAIAPSIASAARAAAAIGWIAVVAAEFIGSRAGLGFLIISAATSVETAVVMAGMVIIGLLGAAISAGIKWLSQSRLTYEG